MSDTSRYYIFGAFVLGVALATAYNNEFSTKQWSSSVTKHETLETSKSKRGSIAARNYDALKENLLRVGHSLHGGGPSIREGIEGCIGDTPLIKIKSLSDYTGCEILAKAEVCKDQGRFAAIY